MVALCVSLPRCLGGSQVQRVAVLLVAPAGAAVAWLSRHMARRLGGRGNMWVAVLLASTMVALVLLAVALSCVQMACRLGAPGCCHVAASQVVPAMTERSMCFSSVWQVSGWLGGREGGYEGGLVDGWCTPHLAAMQCVLQCIAANSGGPWAACSTPVSVPQRIVGGAGNCRPRAARAWQGRMCIGKGRSHRVGTCAWPGTLCIGQGRCVLPGRLMACKWPIDVAGV